MLGAGPRPWKGVGWAARRGLELKLLNLSARTLKRTTTLTTACTTPQSQWTEASLLLIYLRHKPCSAAIVGDIGACGQTRPAKEGPRAVRPTGRRPPGCDHDGSLAGETDRGPRVSPGAFHRLTLETTIAAEHGSYNKTAPPVRNDAVYIN